MSVASAPSFASTATSGVVSGDSTECGKPLVSVITPNKNGLPYIRDTAESVLGQSVTDLEWIVVDDGSSDGSVEFVAALAERDRRVKLFVLRHDDEHGAGPARNKGLDEATGRYVAFVDADDCWTREKLEKQLSFMELTGSSFSFTAYELVDETGRSTGRVIDQRPRRPVTYPVLLRKAVGLGCSTVVLRRSVVGQARFKSLRTGQDFVFWLTLLRRGLNADLLPEPLTRYRVLAGSLSRNKWRRALQQWHIYRHVERLGLLTAVICFASYAYGGLRRK